MARRKFDDHGYPTEPAPTNNPHLWFYVQKEGLLAAWANGTAVVTWQQIRRALEDREKALNRQKRKLFGRGQP